MSNAQYKIIYKLLHLSLLLTSILVSTIAHAANITVSSSRNPVSLDDSFHLIYETDSNVDGSPDFTPIYQYFDVLSSSQSTNMRSINGSWSLKKTWDLTVIAKRAGKVTVPAISFGKDISPVLRVTITPNSTSGNTSQNGSATIPAKIFLEATVDRKQGWVQSQFIYTVRLLRTVNIIGASISEPTVSDPDAIIQPLGEDKYQTTRNGLRYEVFERRYAVFPQKSGPLTINPSTFEGRVNATQPRTIFDQFRMSGQLKRLRSKAINIDIKPAPTSVNLQNWLPATNVQLYEEWSDDIQKVKTGEPITRTITIAAQGLTAVQLPEISFDETTGLKQYPDKSITEDKQDDKGLTGLKQIKVALIPVSAGSYVLPKITIPWWNTATNTAELAEIPATTITAIGSAPVSNAALPPPPVTEPDQTNNLNTENIKQPASTIDATNNSYWKWISLSLALAWLITLFLLLKKRSSQEKINQTTNKITVTDSNIKASASAVVKNAKQNDAATTKTSLIKWAQLFYENDELTNLGQISKLCCQSLKVEIRRLNEVMYSPEKTNWQGEDFITAFNKEQSKSKQNNKDAISVLKPLYDK